MPLLADALRVTDPRSGPRPHKFHCHRARAPFEWGRMLRGLIFDFDGTVIDTEMPGFLGWQETYARHGQTLTFEEYSAVIGTDFQAFNPYRTLEARTGQTLDWEKLDQERREHYHGLIERNPILPGVENLLQAAAAKRLPCAVASSSPIAWVETHLNRIGLRKYFSVLACAGGPLRPKPTPDVYLHALQGLRLAAAEVVAIEDSPHGSAAAHAAGIRCFVVPNPATQQMTFDPRHRRLQSLAEISLDDLEAAAR